MVVVLGIRNEMKHLLILPMVVCLTLFQAQLTDCLYQGVLKRVIRALNRPDNQMVAPVQLNEPVYGPTVPFLGELSEKLSVGKVIRIHGYVLEDAVRFDINLCSDCYEGPMQFHTSIRFNPEDIVRNSFSDRGGWGAEDRAGLSGVFPVALENEFDVVIEVNQDDYNISIDGRRRMSWTFAHRMPFTDVDKIEITGNILIWKIEYTDEPHQIKQEEIEFISTNMGPGTDANARYRYMLNGDVESALTIDIRNPSDAIEKLSMDLRCECVPRN